MKRKTWRKLVCDFVLLKSNKVCAYCGEPFIDEYFDIDHIEPITSGGADNISNLQALHYKCHKLKHMGKRKAKGVSRVIKYKPNPNSFKEQYVLGLLKEYQSLYDECNGNQSEIARRLGISERMIRYYMKRNQLNNRNVKAWTFPTQSLLESIS